MSTSAMTDVDDNAERALGHAILLIARSRGHIAVRGRTNTIPLTVALGDVRSALAEAGACAMPRLMPHVRALTEGLACLVTEMAAWQGAEALPQMAQPISAVA